MTKPVIYFIDSNVKTAVHNLINIFTEKLRASDPKPEIMYIDINQDPDILTDVVAFANGYLRHIASSTRFLKTDIVIVSKSPLSMMADNYYNKIVQQFISLKSLLEYYNKGFDIITAHVNVLHDNEEKLEEVADFLIKAKDVRLQPNWTITDMINFFDSVSNGPTPVENKELSFCNAVYMMNGNLINKIPEPETTQEGAA